VIEKLKQLVREPLIHFLLIGAGIYAAYGFLASNENNEDERTVTISAGDIQTMADQWTQLWNRPPTEQELTGFIRSHVRVQILYREALAMGLDDGDTVIERRLAQKLEMLARSLITPADPTDEILQAWLADNSEQFRAPDLYTITHIFFDPDKRGETTLDDAQTALNKLKELNEVAADFADYGDRFMLQNHYPGRTELQLRKLFGSGFVEQIVDLQPGEWHGPVLSGYGVHLVLVNDVMLAPQLSFDDIKLQIKEQWIGEQIDEMSERFIDELISRYEVDIEETEVPLTVPGAGAAL
jgi:peptidyl-prolyl cis-trans isomerase C